MQRAPVNKWYRLGRWRPFGAPVFIHWPVLVVVGAAVLGTLRDPPLMLVVLASYFGVVLGHELGHAFIAHRLGFKVVGIDVSVFHGCCRYEATDISEEEDVWVSWGGVLAQLLIAACVLGLSLVPAIREFDAFGPVLVFLGYFNVAWAVTNLAPSRGLDGHTAWRIIPLTWRRFVDRKARRGKKKPHLRRVK